MKMPKIDDAVLMEAGRKFLDQERLKKQQRDDFMAGPRAQALKAYFLESAQGASQSDLAYFPENYPFTADEFSMFCHALFETHKDLVQKDSSDDDMFPCYVLRLEGLRISLMIGQGSEFFAGKTQPGEMLTNTLSHTYDI